MRLGSETGSLINHVMASSQQAKPEVGTGATICMWTDRHAATIVKVTRCTVTVQQDHAKRIDKNGMSESQEYEYTPNPDAYRQTFRLNKQGRYRDGTSGAYLTIGTRREYHDFSF